MAFAKAHVVGAGLAGLNAASVLAKAGLAVSLSDSAVRAGGRCRSYFDPSLGLTIDNGNHLVLASNPAVKAFRKRIGAEEPLAGPRHATFPFADLATGERWQLRINDGALPWWVAVPSRRVPATTMLDYLPLGKLLLGKAGQTIGQVIAPKGPVWERMLAPVMLAVLNTDPAASSAVLAANVLKETLAKGGLASAPRIASPTLGAAFIDPAVAWLARHGCQLATGRRLKSIRIEDDRVAALIWADGEEIIAPDAAVVLAVPAWVAGDLLPGLQVPDEHRAIVNAHFAVAPPSGAPEMLGLLGSTSEWVFTHPDRISVTISAADRLVDTPREELARTIWEEVTRALGMEGMPLPFWQIVKEKRATFAATPEQDAKRPPQRTAYRNLFLAGDWVQTGLPATIEGALRSGDSAARMVLGQPLVYGRG
ncbi:MAG: hydroxysqualene dehydroxylase HpnE [Sphingomonadales bacterium]|nr:hydroxysqualene dehydroxylase HpnE [Sphingomonadales bacterium]MDE2171687.1 hydroxysqualene dehydroxylase HpnE [Sphingomonadales bacterium]